jgi:phosphate/phosphite/phosphonate ABC transporter binding protein
MSERLSFGLVPPSSFVDVEPRLNALLRWIGDRVGAVIVRRRVESYDQLVRLVRIGAVDIAWLPPIPFARLDEERLVRSLVCAERGGHDQYVSVIVARVSSPFHTLRDLQGARIGWVDPLSATGYVVPRMRLAARFASPSSIFAAESFFGSHAAVVRAVLKGLVDVGATYAGLGERGELVRGAVMDLGEAISELRVVEAFGAIPPDVLAVKANLDEELQIKLAEAFVATADDAEMIDAVRMTFGARCFAQKPLVGYDLLRTEVEHGVDSGVIPAAAAFLSTKPPPEPT